MRLATTLLATIITAATAATAQRHTEPWYGFIVPGALRIDPLGNTTTLNTSNTPAMFGTDSGTVDVDDRTLLLCAWRNGGAPASRYLLTVDPSGTILRSVQVSPTTSLNQGVGRSSVRLDDDGSYLFLDHRHAGNQRVSRVYRVSRSGAVTTAVNTGPMVAPNTLVVGIDDGDYYVLDIGSGLHRFDRAGQVVTSIPLQGAGSKSGFGQDLATGDFWFGTRSGILRVTRGGIVSTVRNASPPLATVTPYSFGFDRASAARRSVLVSSEGPVPFFVWRYDVQSTAFTTLVSLPNESIRELTPPREVATIEPMPRQWEYRLHFAAHPGQAYALGLSLSGVRPATRLPDGRSIWLNIDALTAPSLDGRLFPVLRNNAGILDANGRATVNLDLRGIPATGINVWALAIVIDPAAPLGIAVIADPVRIRV